MAQSWYSIVDDELSQVDDQMRTEVRSAYPELNDMCEQTLKSRYHIVRPALCVLSYYANGGKEKDIAVNTASCFEAVFEGLHLHDRIDENGQVTGGRKKMFSKVPSTTKVIVAGDFMYVMGFRLAYGKVPKTVPYLMKASSSISDAIFSIVDREHDPNVTEEECMKILADKSGIEYQVLMECGAEQAGAEEDRRNAMRECGTCIGMALRLESELNDLIGDGNMDTLFEGHPSLPIFYSMQDAKSGEKIREIFSKKGISPKEAEQAVSLIKGTDAVDRCKALIRRYMQKASEIISGLSDSDYKKSLLAFVNDEI